MQSSLVLIAAVALAAWGALFYAILLATRPRIGVRSPSVSDGAREPPAVVALLCSNNGQLPECAATATFLDLIARGLLKRSAGYKEQILVGPAASAVSDLLPYERQIYDHVADRARLAGGAVLEDALRLESAEHADKWITGFGEKVVTDARERGLVEQRASLRVCLWLWVSLLIPVGLLSVSAIGIIFGLIAYMILARLVLTLRGQRPTELGSGLLPSYQALRARLQRGSAKGARNGASNEPRLGDRNAAYGVALGVGRALPSPFAAQTGPLVWSNTSGTWREVRIVDAPAFFHSINPVSVLYATPGALVFFGIWAILLHGFTAHPERWGIPDALLAAGWLLWALGNFFVWRFVYRGLYDLRHTTVGVEGQVIYLEAREAPDSEVPGKFHYVAIDDGRRDKAIKHQIDEELFTKLRYGDWLHLDVTPKLGHVRGTRLLPSPSISSG